MLDMRRRTPAIRLAAILGLAAGSASAADPVIPSNPVPTPAEIIAGQQVPAGIFIPLADGAVLHLASGFVCPAALPNVNLWYLLNYDWPLGTGTNVGCGYGRMKNGGPPDVAESKFTVFLVKAPPGTTLTEVYDAYLSEMRTNFPGGTVKGDVILGEPEALASLPEFMSIAENIALDNRPYSNELIVGIVGDWVIEIRSTFPMEFVGGDPMAGVDLPAAAIFWATQVNEYADRIEAAGAN